MKTASFTKVAAVLPIAAMLALTGCGGGGSGSQSNMMPPMNEGGDDPPDVQPLTPATGLTASGHTPHFASAAALAALLPDPANSFSTLSSSIRRDFDAGTAAITDHFSIKSVKSDGNGGFHVTYLNAEADDPEQVIHFSSADFASRDTTSYTKTIDGREYWFWSYTGSFDGASYGESTEFDYFRAVGSIAVGARTQFTYGARTPAGGIPTGSATYTGRAYAEAFDNTLDDIRTEVSRSRIRGSVVLTADFADAAVEGRMFRLSVQGPGEAFADRTPLPSTTRVEISNGRIVDGQFTATLTGVDDNANAPLDESVRGFAGNALGEFYGPDANEFGGAFNMTRAESQDDDWTVLGWFGGTRTDLIGDHDDNEALSAGVNRLDYSSASPRIEAQDANNRVTSVASDGAGGYTVSYLVDGTAQTVTLGVDDIGGLRPEAFSDRDGTNAWFLRRPYSPYRGETGGPKETQGRHYSVKDWGFSIYPDGQSRNIETGIWATVIHGERTKTMPGTGRATYQGNAAAYAFNPSPGQGRASITYSEGYRGRMSLTADFAAGSLSGRISDVEHSARFLETADYRPVSGGSFTIANGAIRGNALSASLSGLGYDGTVSGAFYGPGAAEAAGVVQATHSGDGRLLHGWFGGARQ